jgi:Flp pilus assembly pilin Flp
MLLWGEPCQARPQQRDKERDMKWASTQRGIAATKRAALGRSTSAATTVTLTRHHVNTRALVSRLTRLVLDDHGQDLVEYGLLMLLIAVAVMSTVEAFGGFVDTSVWGPAESLAVRLAALF